MQEDERKCPECAEVIKKEARVCRFCGRGFTTGEVSVATDGLPGLSDDLRARAERLASPEEKPGPELERLIRDAAPMNSVKANELSAALGGFPSARMIVSRSLRLGVSYQRKDGSLSEPVRGTGSIDTQYGVLQPAANLGAGCLSIWLWMGLLLLVAIAVAAVLGVFS